MAWPLLVRNGWVIDGSGAPRVQADVALEGDRIAAIGPGLAGEAARTIDASGRIVAPGFIDAHSHSDLFYFGCPSSESKVRQGCTTEVVGIPFMMAHEVSDLVTGAILAPLIIFYASQRWRPRVLAGER